VASTAAAALESAAVRLKVTEVFFSIQGEACFSGWPTVFVRLTGCPLRCQYCDTAYAFTGGEWRSFEDIETEVRRYGTRYVCVTGGEPLAQPRCAALLTALCDAGFDVSLETSGAIDIAGVPITPAALAGLIAIVEKGTISSTVAKDVFAKMYETGRSASDIVAADGLAQISDTSSLEPIVRRIVDANPDIIAEIKAGKDRKFQFLVGQVMKETKGKGDPKIVTDLMKAAIG